MANKAHEIHHRALGHDFDMVGGELIGFDDFIVELRPRGASVGCHQRARTHACDGERYTSARHDDGHRDDHHLRHGWYRRASHASSPRRLVSIASQMQWIMRIWTSWIRAVTEFGTHKWTSSGVRSSPSLPPPLPLNATMRISRSCAASTAAIT